MEIDLNLVRVLVLWGDAGNFFSSVPGYEAIDDEDKVKYHKALLLDCGFFTGKMLKNSRSSTAIPQNVVIRGLGNVGKGFLRYTKNDVDWASAESEVLRLLVNQ